MRPLFAFTVNVTVTSPPNPLAVALAVFMFVSSANAVPPSSVIPAAETAVAAAPFRNVRLDISLLINALLFLRFFISAFSS